MLLLSKDICVCVCVCVCIWGRAPLLHFCSRTTEPSHERFSVCLSVCLSLCLLFLLTFLLLLLLLFFFLASFVRFATTVTLPLITKIFDICPAWRTRKNQNRQQKSTHTSYCTVSGTTLYDNRDNSNFAARKKEKQGGRSVGWRSHLSHDQARSISL